MSEYRVREIAEARGIANPHALSLLCGKSRGAIAPLWEGTAERPETAVLRAISRALHVEIGELYAPDPQLEVVPLKK